MAHVSDIKRLVQFQAFDQEHRTLILLDKINGGAVWCKFVHRYDDSNRSSVDLYFDSTWRSIKVSEESMVFTVEVLPILAHIGKYQITIIEHTREGCAIRSGDSSSIDSVIGME